MRIKCLFLLFLHAAVAGVDTIPVLSPQTHYTDRRDQQTGEKIVPTILILHYTVASLARTLKIFSGHANAHVAAHYTISEDGVIFKHVDEEDAAYHAGLSYWCNKTALNRHSVGIEHVNAGYKETEDQPVGIIIEGSDKEWYPFPLTQIAASLKLCKEIIARYNIHPRNIVGHSDVAPGRKADPGPLFPWKELADEGIGAWPKPENFEIMPCLKNAYETQQLEAWLIEHLHLWGYKLPDETTSAQAIIQAFQMHFRQSCIDGHADYETCVCLNALLCEYCQEHVCTHHNGQ